MLISIVIPVFRGGDILRPLFNSIYSTLIDKYDFEVLFICDGCDPGSYSVLKELKKSCSEHIKIYYFTRNYGQHKAIQFGLGKAVGEFIVTMDEDLQHDPSDILKLLDKQSEGDYDIVYGRFPVLQHPGIRNKISEMLRKVLKYYIPALYDNYSPYRLIRREIAWRVAAMVSPYTFIDDLLSRTTQMFASVDLNHYRRVSGRSSYTLPRLLKHGVAIIFAYSGINTWLLKAGGVLIFSGIVLVILKGFFTIDVFPEPLYYFIIPMTGLMLFLTGLSGLALKNLRKNMEIVPKHILL